MAADAAARAYHAASQAHRSNNLPSAILWYEKALSLTPRDAPSYNGLAVARRDTNDLKAALAAHAHAIKLAPNDALVQSNYGHTLLKADKAHEAVKRFKKAAKLEPSANNYIDLAEAHRAAYSKKSGGDHVSGAERAINKAVALDKDLPLDRRAYMLHWLGKLMIMSGEFTRARTACARALELVPDLSGAHLCLGDCERGPDSLEAGASHYNAAAKSAQKGSAEQIAAFIHLARLQHGHGLLFEAVESLKKAYRIGLKTTSKKLTPSQNPANNMELLKFAAEAAALFAQRLIELPPSEDSPVQNATEAYKALQHALKWAHQSRNLLQYSNAQITHARLGLLTGDHTSAIDRYREAVTSLRSASSGNTPSATERFDHIAAEYVSFASWLDDVKAQNVRAPVTATGELSTMQERRPHLFAPDAVDVDPPPACDTSANGGGSCNTAPEPSAPYVCSIERLNYSQGSLTPDAFVRRYATRGKPVLLKGGCMDFLGLEEKWTHERLRSLHGQHSINLTRSSMATARQYGGAQGDRASERTTTLGAFVSGLAAEQPKDEVEADPWYLITKKLPWIASELTHHPLFEEGFELSMASRDEMALLSIGAHSSGAHFHQHSDAWNCVVYGRKRWGLIPPAAEYRSPTDSSAVWWETIQPRLRASRYPYLHECVQEAGDLLFVPTAWLHTVYNLATTVSVAVQVGAPSKSWAEYGIVT